VLLKMNTVAHMFVGELLHDRIIGALELCCRRGEMLLIQNKGSRSADWSAKVSPKRPRGIENLKKSGSPHWTISATG
jgi:hypothetical protein